MRPRIALRALRVAGALAALAFVLGVGVRMTVRDGHRLAQALFYATPWPVLALLAAFAAFVAWRERGPWRAWRWPAACAAAACLAAWLASDLRVGGREPAAPETFRVVQWNVSRPTWQLPRVARRVLELEPDLLVLNESRPRHDVAEPRWREALSPLVVTELKQIMLVASAGGAAEPVRRGTFDGWSDFDVRRVRLGGRDVTLVVVDLAGAPLRPRGDDFAAIERLVRRYGEGPLLVAGDFNTPTDSAWFPPLLATMQESFRAAGHGLAGTWPAAAPVLSVDHVLASRHFRVVRCEHEGSWLSDHRAVVVDLAWADEPPPS